METDRSFRPTGHSQAAEMKVNPIRNRVLSSLGYNLRPYVLSSKAFFFYRF